MGDPKSAQRQFLVKVAGISGYFMTKTGGNITAETSKVRDGGSDQPDVIPGPAEAEDVTVSRPFSVARDGNLLPDLRRKVGSWVTTVSVTPTDANLVPVGTATVYSDAILTGVNEPEVDANSGDAATFELTFAVGSFK